MSIARSICAVLACLVAACGTGSDPVGVQDAAKEQSARAAIPMSRRDMLRAVAARSRTARSGAAPTQTFSRTYSRDGRLISERIWNGKVWVDRPSTISGAILSRRLDSFLDGPSAANLRVQASIASHVTVDTIGGIPQTVYDTVWIEPTVSSQVTTHDAPAVNDSWVGELFYPSADSTGSIAQSTGGVVYTIDTSDGGDEILETVVTGGDWAYVLAVIDSTVSAASSLRADGGLRQPSLWASQSNCTLPTTPAGMTASLMLPYNCNTIKYMAGLSFTVALGAGAGAVLTSLNPGTAFVSPLLGRAAIGSFLTGVAGMITYRQCLREQHS